MNFFKFSQREVQLFKIFPVFNKLISSEKFLNSHFEIAYKSALVNLMKFPVNSHFKIF